MAIAPTAHHNHIHPFQSYCELEGETRVATGAGVGAIVGGILGGIEGVLTGVLIGAGGTVAATEGKDVVLRADINELRRRGLDIVRRFRGVRSPAQTMRAA
jgi:hypothetical protein